MNNYVPPPALKGFESMKMAQPSLSTSMPMTKIERHSSELSNTSLDFVDELLASPLAAEDEALLLREIEVETNDERAIDQQPLPNLVCSAAPTYIASDNYR